MIRSILITRKGLLKSGRPPIANNASPGKWIFIISLNAYFLLPFFFPADLFSPVPKTWRYYVAAYMCILIGAVWDIRRLPQGIKPDFKRWIGLYAGLLILMISQSLIVGEPIQNILWNGVVYLSLIVLAILGQSRTLWTTLNHVFILQTFVGSIYILQIILRSEISQREELMVLPGINVISPGSYVIPAVLYALPFILFTLPMQSRFGKLVAGLGYAGLILYVLFWQSRVGSVLLIVQLVLFSFILWRCQRLKIYRVNKIMRFAIVSGFAIAIMIGWTDFGRGLISRSNRGLSLLITRWTMSGDMLGTSGQDARIFESGLFLQQVRWHEWLVGRGVAATWQDPRIYQGAARNMLHIGYLHYILVGGILLFFLMVFPFVRGLRVFLKSKDLIKIATGGIWIEYSIMLLFYGFPSASLTWVLVGLAFGNCLAVDNCPSPVPTRIHKVQVDMRK